MVLSVQRLDLTEMYHNIKSLRLYSQETVEVLYWIIMGMS